MTRNMVRSTVTWSVPLERCFSTPAECVALQEEWDAHENVLHVLDLDGSAVHTESPLGRFMMSVLESAQTLVLLRDGVEVLRETVRLDPTGRTLVRL